MELSRTQDCEETSSQRRPDSRPDAGSATGRWTSGSADRRPDARPDAGGNRPDVGQQRPIEYSKVPERQIYDWTRPVAGDRTLASVRSVYCRLNGRDDRTRPIRTIQRPVSSSFAGIRPQRLLSQWAYKYSPNRPFEVCGAEEIYQEC